MVIQIQDNAHQVSIISWFQAGFILTTGLNSAFVLCYLEALLLPMGWGFGVVSLIAATIISLHANVLDGSLRVS